MSYHEDMANQETAKGMCVPESKEGHEIGLKSIDCFAPECRLVVCPIPMCRPSHRSPNQNQESSRSAPMIHLIKTGSVTQNQRSQDEVSDILRYCPTALEAYM